MTAVVDFVRDSRHGSSKRRRQLPHSPGQELREEPPPFEADSLAARGRMSFRYLPPGRAAASTRQRVFNTRAGLWLVRTLRKPQSLGRPECGRSPRDGEG